MKIPTSTQGWIYNECIIHMYFKIGPNLFWRNILDFIQLRFHERFLWCFAMAGVIISQWYKWPKFVSLHYWRAPRGARGVKKSRRSNWSPLWWVGALRFSPNWRNCEIPSKLNKKCQRNPVFWRYFKFYSIWAES